MGSPKKGSQSLQMPALILRANVPVKSRGDIFTQIPGLSPSARIIQLPPGFVLVDGAGRNIVPQPGHVMALRGSVVRQEGPGVELQDAPSEVEGSVVPQQVSTEVQQGPGLELQEPLMVQQDSAVAQQGSTFSLQGKPTATTSDVNSETEPAPPSKPKPKPWSRDPRPLFKSKEPIVMYSRAGKPDVEKVSSNLKVVEQQSRSVLKVVKNVQPQESTEEDVSILGEKESSVITTPENVHEKQLKNDPKKFFITNNPQLASLPPSICKIVTLKDGSQKVLVCQKPAPKVPVPVSNPEGCSPAVPAPPPRPKPKPWSREPRPLFKSKEPVVMYSGCKPEDLQLQSERKKKKEKPPESLFCPPQLDVLLPKPYTYHISSFEELKNPDSFKAEIRTNISKKEEALDWLKEFEDMSGTNFRIAKTFKENSTRLIFKKCFKCFRNTYRKDQVRKRESKRHVGCQARLSITIKNPDMKSSCDLLLAQFPCVIGMYHNHCHSLKTPESLRCRRPLPEVRQKFADMYRAQVTPSMALRVHKADLKRQYGDKYEEVVNDGARCPLLPWCYRLYYEICGKKVKDGKKRSSRKSSYIPKKRRVASDVANIASFSMKRGHVPNQISQENSSVVENIDSRHYLNDSLSARSALAEEVQRSIDSLYELDLLPKDNLDQGSNLDASVQISTNCENAAVGLKDKEESTYNESEDLLLSNQEISNNGDSYIEDCEVLGNDDCVEAMDTDQPQSSDSMGVDHGVDNIDVVSSSIPPAYSSSDEVGTAKQNLKDIFDEISRRLSNQPEMYLPIVEKFITDFNRCKESTPDSELVSALLNFGSEFSQAQVLSGPGQEATTNVDGVPIQRKRPAVTINNDSAIQGNSKRKVLVLRMDPNKLNQMLGKVEEKAVREVMNI